MAWVLPGSLLHSNYSNELLNNLASRFATVTAIQLAERVFLSVGTEERTVILVCEGHKESPIRQEMHYCETVDDLSIQLEQKDSQKKSRINLIANSPASKKNNNGRDVYLAISHQTESISLGAICRVVIGTVTGANSPGNARHARRASTTPIVSFTDAES